MDGYTSLREQGLNFVFSSKKQNITRHDNNSQIEGADRNKKREIKCKIRKIVLKGEGGHFTDRIYRVDGCISSWFTCQRFHAIVQ